MTDKIDLMIDAILTIGYQKHCSNKFDNSRDRLDDLKELMNFSHTYKSLESFLSDTSLGEAFKGESSIEPSAFDEDYLVLSTIHQAKGLEWPAVIVIGLIDNQFPHAKSKDDPRQLEEERRLFYVAATRAKDYLYLTHPMTRYDYNYGTVTAQPSVFIEELPVACYEAWEVDLDYSSQESQLLYDYD